jgi:hypothetical protein
MDEMYRLAGACPAYNQSGPAAQIWVLCLARTRAAQAGGSSFWFVSPTPPYCPHSTASLYSPALERKEKGSRARFSSSSNRAAALYSYTPNTAAAFFAAFFGLARAEVFLVRTSGFDVAAEEAVCSRVEIATRKAAWRAPT